MTALTVAAVTETELTVQAPDKPKLARGKNGRFLPRNAASTSLPTAGFDVSTLSDDEVAVLCTQFVNSNRANDAERSRFRSRKPEVRRAGLAQFVTRQARKGWDAIAEGRKAITAAEEALKVRIPRASTPRERELYVFYRRAVGGYDATTYTKMVARYRRNATGVIRELLDCTNVEIQRWGVVISLVRDMIAAEEATLAQKAGEIAAIRAGSDQAMAAHQAFVAMVTTPGPVKPAVEVVEPSAKSTGPTLEERRRTIRGQIGRSGQEDKVFAAMRERGKGYLIPLLTNPVTHSTNRGKALDAIATAREILAEVTQSGRGRKGNKK